MPSPDDKPGGHIQIRGSATPPPRARTNAPSQPPGSWTALIQIGPDIPKMKPQDLRDNTSFSLKKSVPKPRVSEALVPMRSIKRLHQRRDLGQGQSLQPARPGKIMTMRQVMAQHHKPFLVAT